VREAASQGRADQEERDGLKDRKLGKRRDVRRKDAIEAGGAEADDEKEDKQDGIDDPKLNIDASQDGSPTKTDQDLASGFLNLPVGFAIRLRATLATKERVADHRHPACGLSVPGLVRFLLKNRNAGGGATLQTRTPRYRPGCLVTKVQEGGPLPVRLKEKRKTDSAEGLPHSG
jgi:hypothetical protein